ncbi:MAG: Mrp/NBP35 family ATP-binding protein [Anaerolineae bacterium]|nr:Mrp/NBP35 family ATP-binding protein [Anaerolineae bacterium]
MVRDLKFKDGLVSMTLALTVPTCPMRERIASDARAALTALPEVKRVDITFGAMTDQERARVLGGAQPNLPKLNDFNEIKQVIAIMSGKGGVGKSSVTARLAVALARKGYHVGVLDADITGPSIPKLFGLAAGGLRSAVQGMLPAQTDLGIKVMSINLLVKEDDAPVIWRGPMITSAIRQFWGETLWGKLDYLLVDMPPGTSDAAITVVQNLPLNGVILVSTPQDLASMVVRKAVNMLLGLKIAIIGVVENMSYFRCPDTGNLHYIFGPSHAEDIARLAGAPLSVCLPIDPQVAIYCDQGQAELVNTEELGELVNQVETFKKA